MSLGSRVEHDAATDPARPVPVNGARCCFVLLAAAACLGGVGGVGAGAANTDIVAAARQQIGVTVRYDPAYRRLAFPGGDVAADRGVCTDVVVRALRVARSLDLQAELHADITANPAAYPLRRWGSDRPDASIDHRRVPNQMVWLRRRGYERPLSGRAQDYLPGDIVAWDLGGGVLHVGIVSAARTMDGTPLVIHNIGAGAREEDILFRYRIIGWYRLPADRPATRSATP